MDPNNPNLYVYCGNNPLVRIDPTGHFWDELGNALRGNGWRKSTDEEKAERKRNREQRASSGGSSNSPSSTQKIADPLKAKDELEEELNPGIPPNPEPGLPGDGPTTPESVNPKGGTYTKDSELLYNSALDAFYDPQFDPEPTKCNMFAAEILYQYTGSTELMGKVVVDQYEHVTSSSKWGKVSPEEAEKLAKEGSFVLAITPDPNHVAVVMPRDGITKGGMFFPAIAQQGKSKYLPGETDPKSTANWGWLREDQSKIEYYVKF